jgi:multiple sugar transport system substrate-binding protein
LFEKYTNEFQAEYGYPLAYGPDSTWKNVLDFAKFFSDRRKKTGSGPYGMGLHLGSFAWTTQLDIQKMLYAHGQWAEFDIDDVKGAKQPGKTRWGDDQSIKILQLYKDLFDTSSPDALSIGTVELVNSFASGEVAMCTEFHEDAAPFEDPKSSQASGGRTAYDVCPKGDKEYLVGSGKLVNGTNCGIAGIGINKGVSEKQKKAAWLFCVWSTMTQTQRDNLAISGGTPTRTAVLDIPEIKTAEGKKYGLGDTGRVGPSDFPNALTFPAISMGMATPNAILGPKIPQINEYVTIVANEIQKMCAGKSDPETTAKNIQKQTDAATGA